MKLPPTYNYTLRFWMRLRENSLAGNSKKCSDQNPELSISTEIHSKEKMNSELSFLPSWIPNFVTDIFNTSTELHDISSKRFASSSSNGNHISASKSTSVKDCGKPAEKENIFLNMTCEEYAVYFPEDASDFIRRPTFWPHDQAEQLTKADILRQKKIL